MINNNVFVVSNMEHKWWNVDVDKQECDYKVWDLTEVPCI